MILSGHANIDNQRLLDKCIELSKNPRLSKKQNILFPGVINSHWGNIKKDKKIQGESSPHTWPEWMQIQELIEEYVPYSSIETSWFNIMPYNSTIHLHTHPHSSKSVLIYYPYTIPEHPAIEFLINNEWCSFYPTSGDWFIFPNNLPHRVKTNSRSEPRVSISINFNTGI
jgi:hypothetical protein